MPLWLQIVIAVFGLIGTAAGIVGFTAYWNERMKHKAQIRNNREDREAQEIEELRHQKYMSDLRKIIKEENELSVAPIRSKLAQVESQISILADGTTDMLRERILSTYYKCIEKGYRTQYDYENIEHMHKDYVGLGGNSFVSVCVNAIKGLPSEEEYKAKKKQGRKPKAKKQVLVEDKK